MTDPAVSVVITCFNYAHWLPDSVDSVLEQSLTDFELLIVDDGSTDDSLAVAGRLAAGDDRITVLTQANAGQPAIPRNRAIERARGRYIASLDADDRLGPTALERSAAALDGDPRAGLAYLQQQDFGASCDLHPLLDWRLERLKRTNFLPSATMFRRAAWQLAGGYNTNVRGYEDWDLWLGIAEAGFCGLPVPDALWFYRRHEGGVFNQSKGGDLRLKAQVIVNRPGVFGDGVLDWARRVLADDPAALAVPQQLVVVPDIPDPPHLLRTARDRGERADWYVEVDGLQGPWTSRTLQASLALVDALGYTVVRVDGAVAARKRASDPRPFPVPFFVAPVDPAVRAAALAGALEDLVITNALRRGAALDAGCIAQYLSVPVSEVPGLVSEAQSLMRGHSRVRIDRAAQLGRLASVLRSEFAVAGDEAGVQRAVALERAASRAGLEQARGVAILAFAEELILNPSLLKAYGEAVSADHDLTLVIATREVEPLIAAVAEAGLDADGTADLLAVDAPPPGVDAVLSRRDYGGLPRFDESSLDSLLTFAAESSRAAGLDGRRMLGTAPLAA